MKAFLLALVTLAVATASRAAVTPRPGPQDPRIQTVEYNAQQVVTLSVALGYDVTLEFSPDERIENVAVGNSAVWQVTPNKSADHLFVKPLRGAVETDMTVITDARTYNFELKATQAFDPGMAFIIRFLYPVAVTAPDSSMPDLKSAGQSFTYRFSGSKLLRPIDMSDDGQFTSMTWAPKAPIPAVYFIDGQGREALVNGAVRDGRFVVDQIADVFIFRMGNEEARAQRHLVKGRKR